jgi:hypothetical protein
MRIRSFAPVRYFLTAFAVSVWCLHAHEFGGITASNVTVTEYDGLTPIVQIHATRIFTDYERHGFFRIGVLPVSVVENAHIEIQSVESLTNALLALHEWTRAAAARRSEIRHIEIALGNEPQPRLTASRARVADNGMLELSNVLVAGPNGEEISAACGVLQVAGNVAGRLSLNINGRPEELFPLKSKDKTP